MVLLLGYDCKYSRKDCKKERGSLFTFVNSLYSHHDPSLLFSNGVYLCIDTINAELWSLFLSTQEDYPCSYLDLYMISRPAMSRLPPAPVAIGTLDNYPGVFSRSRLPSR
jgi:hypothetical protein